MGLSGILHRIAASAPVPVFIVAGTGGRDQARWLRLRSEVDVVDSPRHATILLVTGAIGPDGSELVARLHDQLPHPRAALWWQDKSSSSAPFDRAVAVGPTEDDVVGAVVATHRKLLLGEQPTSVAALADVDPNPWRGVGPYGQGGKGMTGGTPYGRELAGRAPDRDGLELDQLAVTVGPWWAGIPPGLVLDLKVQGDVVQEATVRSGLVAPTVEDDVFHRALTADVEVGALEMARARHHLCWGSDVLRLLGLAAEADRVLATAARIGDGATAADLRAASETATRLASKKALRHPLRNVGTLQSVDVRDTSGPVARASGLEVDARRGDRTYQALGFRSIVASEGDALARWRVRMGEAVQSLALAAGAAAATVRPGGSPVESPRGAISLDRPAPSAALAALVPRVLEGSEWGDAMVALASLDVSPGKLAVGVLEPPGTGA